jgi:hypothetical protein
MAVGLHEPARCVDRCDYPLARCCDRAGTRAFVGLNAWPLSPAQCPVSVSVSVGTPGRVRGAETLKKHVETPEMFTKKPIYKKTKKRINYRWPMHWASVNKEVH